MNGVGMQTTEDQFFNALGPILGFMQYLEHLKFLEIFPGG